MSLAVSLESDFDYEGHEYRVLFERCGMPPFAHPLWVKTAADIFPRARGMTMRTLTVRDVDGGLRLVLPLAERGRGALRVVQFAHFGVSDYTDILVTQDDLARFAEDDALVARIRSALRTAALVRLPRVRADAVLVARLLGGGTPRPAPSSAHAIELPATLADWHTRIGRKARQNLARRRRNAQGEGPLVFARAGREALPAVLDTLLAYRRERFPASDDAFQRADGFAFYRALAEGGWSDGFVSVYTLHHRDRLVAIDYTIRAPGGECLLLRGLHPQAETKFSYGMQMLEDLVRSGIERGDAFLDLTVGDEPYKAEIGAIAAPIAIVERTGNVIGRALRAASRSDGMRAGLRRLQSLVRPAA